MGKRSVALSWKKLEPLLMQMAVNILQQESNRRLKQAEKNKSQTSEGEVSSWLKDESKQRKAMLGAVAHHLVHTELSNWLKKEKEEDPNWFSRELYDEKDILTFSFACQKSFDPIPEIFYLKNIRLYYEEPNKKNRSASISTGVAESIRDLLRKYVDNSIQLSDLQENADVAEKSGKFSADSQNPNENVNRIRAESKIHNDAVDGLDKCLKMWPELIKEIEERSPNSSALNALLEYPNLFELLDKLLYKAIKRCLAAILGNQVEFDKHWENSKEILGYLCLLELEPAWLKKSHSPSGGGTSILKISVETRYGVEVVRAGRWNGYPQFEEEKEDEKDEEKHNEKRKDFVGRFSVEFDENADEPGFEEGRAVDKLVVGVWNNVNKRQWNGKGNNLLFKNSKKIKMLQQQLTSERLRERHHHVTVDIVGQPNHFLAIDGVCLSVARLLPDLPIILWGTQGSESERIFKSEESKTKEHVVTFLLLRQDLTNPKP